jgi:signal peptidase I
MEDKDEKDKINDDRIIDFLSRHGALTATVKGSSMLPYLKDGDVIAVSKCDNFEIGDVVVYKAENEYIVHRIIDIVKAGTHIFYITKGDNCTAADRIIPASAVVGKQVGVIK